MWKELEFAKDMFFMNLIAKSNAFNVVQALNIQAKSNVHNYVASIIGDIINFNVFFRSLRVLHVGREANHAAYYLAQYSLHNPDYIWIEEILPCISAVLTFNLLSDFC